VEDFAAPGRGPGSAVPNLSQLSPHAADNCDEFGFCRARLPSSGVTEVMPSPLALPIMIIIVVEVSVLPDQIDPVTDVDVDADPVETDAVGPLTERLLSAAAEVFAERGYDGAGVAEIARRAGVTTGAIYSRYRGKAELLVAALDVHTTDELDLLFADHRFEGRMEDIIRIAGSHLVDPDEAACPDLLLEAFVAARRHPDVAEMIRSRMDERRGRLKDIIETAKSDGGISSAVDTDALVAFCHAVGFGFLLFQAVDSPMPGRLPWEDLISRLVAALGNAALDPPTTADPTSTLDPTNPTTMEIR
jgi:AcrR family transcriptional regulator